jgi:hypothetical protein
MSAQSMPVCNSIRTLCGECDFLVARTNRVPCLQAPVVLTVTVPKDGDVFGSIILCAAQMLGARAFNRRTAVKTLYGCVTTGRNWSFLSLQDDTLTLDRDLYYPTHYDKILGILVECMKGSDPQ